MFLIFDTETTGLPRDKNAPITDFDNWPRAVQLAWQLLDNNGLLLESGNRIIRPEGFTIPFNASRVHGITTELALRDGHKLEEVLADFQQVLNKADYTCRP